MKAPGWRAKCYILSYPYNIIGICGTSDSIILHDKLACKPYLYGKRPEHRFA